MKDHELAAFVRAPQILPPNRVRRSYRGGSLLDRFRGNPCPEDNYFPEDWVGSTTTTRMLGRPTDEGLSRISLPDRQSIFLRDALRSCPETMLGETHVRQHGTELALLCKLLDSAMRLPLQVHPTAAFARAYLGSPFGKTECWIVLGTRIIDNEDPYVLFGFKTGVTHKEFERATTAQATLEQVDMLQRIPVRPGDVYLVPAGIPHAIGPGVFLLEVQEPTDLTISVEYTFGGVVRSHEQCFLGLGFERAMQCFDFTAHGMEFVRRCVLEARVTDAGREGAVEELVGVVNTPCFDVLRLRVHGTHTWRRDPRACVAIVIEGKGRLLSQEGERPLYPGVSYFVPAYCDELTVQHTADHALTVLACFPPRVCR